MFSSKYSLNKELLTMPRFLVRSSSHCISSNYRHLWLMGSDHWIKQPHSSPTRENCRSPQITLTHGSKQFDTKSQTSELDSSGQWSRESNNRRKKYRRIWSHMLHMHIWNLSYFLPHLTFFQIEQVIFVSFPWMACIRLNFHHKFDTYPLRPQIPDFYHIPLT